MAAAAHTESSARATSRVRGWLMDGLTEQVKHHPGPHAEPDPTRAHGAWWKVMCLTGVDYFSTLGYQPGIAALAAGLLSPMATLILVVLTLFGALPVYRRVAAESPHGEGSIAMLERLLSFWKGKLFVLVLLGFAATDFLITMTLSAADATAHFVENPNVPTALHGHEVLITLVLLGLLGAIFLKGFREAIGIAVVLVIAYLALNAVVIGDALVHVGTHMNLLSHWTTALTAQHGSPLAMVAFSLVVFPKLALGMSGFETGVAVMPHIQGSANDTEASPCGRIRGARRLLTTAALTMSVFLLTSSLACTLLIPEAEFRPGGQANGRALAYLAHEYLGNVFGTTYDLSTIAILWFAGASAMAGMLNLIPRYLPRYGMAPQWSRATRPLVLVLTTVASVVTWIFNANVDAQGGAYATGVLVLFTSAGAAVTLAARRAGQRRAMVGFAIVTVAFAYTTVDNIRERPDGVKIGAFFIASILLVSLISRLWRALELRVTDVALDDQAKLFIRDCSRRQIRIVANNPEARDEQEYRDKIRQLRADHDLADPHDLIFVEITVTDPSDFETRLDVHGEVMHGRFRVLTARSSSVPNALAALLLHVREFTGIRPHIYFEWTEGNPAIHFIRFLLFGVGEVAPVTREIVRRAERRRRQRPHVHVG